MVSLQYDLDARCDGLCDGVSPENLSSVLRDVTRDRSPRFPAFHYLRLCIMEGLRKFPEFLEMAYLQIVS